MTAKSPLNIILGLANVGDSSIDPLARFDKSEDINAFLDAFYNRGYRQIDTARMYSPHAPGSSEPRLGAVEAFKKFSIDTKVLSRSAGDHSAANIKKSIDDSLAALRVSQVDIEYLHQPDRTVPFEETCEAMDKGYREGKFKRFGLSNYTAQEVEKIVQICEKNGFVKPTVYQGQYNPIVRGGEKDLFPVLRKHGIAFYAWSPAAAGFFTGKYKQKREETRFDTSHFLGQVYSSAYMKPAIEVAVDRARDIASKHGISGHAAALRWTVNHSILSAKYGDAVIIGASSIEQLTQNLDLIEEGALPHEVVDAVEAVYKEIGDSEPSYHF